MTRNRRVLIGATIAACTVAVSAGIYKLYRLLSVKMKGRGIWLWNPKHCYGNDWSKYAKLCQDKGIRYVVGPKVKSGKTTHLSVHDTSSFIATMHAKGIKVFLWCEYYGTKPTVEAADHADYIEALTQLGTKPDGWVVDFEWRAGVGLDELSDKVQAQTCLELAERYAPIMRAVVPVIAISTYAKLSWHHKNIKAVAIPAFDLFLPQSYWCSDRHGDETKKDPAWWTTDLEKTDWLGIPLSKIRPTGPAYTSKGYIADGELTCAIRGNVAELEAFFDHYPNANAWVLDSINLPGIAHDGKKQPEEMLDAIGGK
jgi:hypothetical protein